VENYIRILVTLTPTLSFPVISSKHQTVENLAHQIEAEYAYRFLIPLPSGKTEGKPEDESQTEEDVMEPIECGALYVCGEEGMKPLRFTDTVGEVLESDGVVGVMNVNEGKQMWGSVSGIDLTTSQDSLSQSINPSKSGFVLDTTTTTTSLVSTTSPRSASRSNLSVVQPTGTTMALSRTPSHSGRLPSFRMSTIFNATLDDRFQSVLHNRVAIEYFINFWSDKEAKSNPTFFKNSIEDHTIDNLLFYLDVELFQGIPDSSHPHFARYIYMTYIRSGAPVPINLSEEIRRDVVVPSVTTEEGVDTAMFDESQEIVYSVLKGQAFVRFEKSAVYAGYQEKRRNDRMLYQAASIRSSYYSVFKPDPEWVTTTL
ncbi:hypothetical protein HK104_007436, partial [Borealophlyctis nickersoniae]